MQEDDFVIKQVELSKARGLCTTDLKKVIFTSVSEALQLVYGQEKSMRCVESSVAIKTLLKRLGIESFLIKGSLRTIEILNGGSIRESGFWGENHHFWVMSQFAEIVDLTVSYLHLHPASYEKAAIPHPPVWCFEPDLPPAVQYEMTNSCREIQILNEEEDRHMKELTIVAENNFEKMTLDKIAKFGSIIGSVEI
jgi:hypothetical protein